MAPVELTPQAAAALVLLLAAIERQRQRDRLAKEADHESPLRLPGG